MAKITPNMDEAVDFSTIPPGTFKMRITGDEVKTTAKGDPMVSWKLTIFGAEGDADQYNGRVVFHNTMLAGKGSGSFRSLWMAVNNVANVADVPNTLDCDTEDFLGKEVLATLGIREYQGSEFNEIKSVGPIH